MRLLYTSKLKCYKISFKTNKAGITVWMYLVCSLFGLDILEVVIVCKLIVKDVELSDKSRLCYKMVSKNRQLSCSRFNATYKTNGNKLARR